MRNLFLKNYKNISVQTVKWDILDFFKDFFFQILRINYKFSQDLLTFFIVIFALILFSLTGETKMTLNSIY